MAEVRVVPQGRSAIARVDDYVASVYGLTVGEHKCEVWGCFQLQLEDRKAEPVFVCEFEDGTVVNIYTEYVKFIMEE